jgi:predicted glycosyltransferase
MINFKNIDKQIIIDFLQEGTNFTITVIDFNDFGVFQEMIYVFDNGYTKTNEKGLVSINKKELFNFIRRRKINKIINKDEQHITENTHF